MPGREQVDAPGLSLQPFRGWRYDPARVGDLSAVVAPPYDVVGDAELDRLAHASPHNVVHLTRPGSADAGGPRRAADRLRAWRQVGVLRQDRRPALYVLEQRAPGVPLHRALVGALRLHAPEEGVVLPHEDVMPGPVADRLALRQATQADLEPILLLAEGGAGTGALVDDVAASRAPDAALDDASGARHSLWVVDDSALLARAGRGLDGARGLIADGHHRYATYLQHRALGAAELASGIAAADGRGGGHLPHSALGRGLAAVVDPRHHPLHLGAIHRVVAGLGVGDAVAALRGRYLMRVAPAAVEHHETAVRQAPEGSFGVRGVAGAWTAVPHDLDALAAEVPDGGGARSREWRRLVTAALHEVLLPHVLAVAEARTSYHHDASAADAAARATSGTAVLLAPVDPVLVVRLAARGERMPRKSTSFGPKPLSGLVLRLLDAR